MYATNIENKNGEKVCIIGINPYICSPNAEIAQLVEHDLAKVGVASSSLVFRSSTIL